MIPVRFVPEVRDDLLALPSDDLRRIAIQWMHRLRSDPYLGARLQWRRDRDLTRCRKLYFDEDDQPLRILQPFVPREGGPRYRVVYTLVPRPERPEVVRILAVGLKIRHDGQGVYYDASDRQ